MFSVQAQYSGKIGFGTFEQILNSRDDTLRIVNFWATWCKPCVEELPHFVELQDKYRSHPVKVILISLDFPKQLNSRLLPFLEENNVNVQVYLLDEPNPNAWIPRVHPDWTGSIPATLIWKKNERKFVEKSFSRNELFELTNQFLNP